MGRKRTLKPTAVPSVFHWKKTSPVKQKAPTRGSPIKRKKATEKKTVKADLPTCDSTCEIFVEPQETPFLSSITENLENTTVDQPADDSQSIIRDIQIEKEQLRKEIHQVTILIENFKLKVEELTHRISVLEDSGNKGESISYWHSDDSATVNYYTLNSLTLFLLAESVQ